MQAYRLIRTGLPTVCFTGTLLASAPRIITADDSQRGRWHDLRLYRTQAGHAVLEIIYQTDWPGEQCYHQVCVNPVDIGAYLLAYGQLPHVRPSDPSTIAAVRAAYHHAVCELLVQMKG